MSTDQLGLYPCLHFIHMEVFLTFWVKLMCIAIYEQIVCVNLDTIQIILLCISLSSLKIFDSSQQCRCKYFSKNLSIKAFLHTDVLIIWENILLQNETGPLKNNGQCPGFVL